MQLEKIKINKLKAATYNPRQISTKQYNDLKKSLDKFGVVDPIIINKDYTVIGGHQRLKICKELNHKEIGCIILDLDKDDERELNIRLNKNTGEFDMDILANEFDIDNLVDWGFKHIDLGLNIDKIFEGNTEDDHIPEVKESRVKLGDVWQLGKNRLMCGDSTKKSDVEKLMNGDKADMVFTSPPYNSGGNSGTGGYRGNEKRQTKEFYNQCSDNWTKSEYKLFLIKVLKNIHSICTEISPILWNVMYNANARDDYGKIVFSDDNPFTVKETIIWDKGVGMNITATGILSRTCELIFLMSKGDKYYTNQKKEVYWNTWRISNRGGGNMQYGHGASFPVDLPKEGIIKFSKKNHIIYEPFLGSGTTLIACEKTNRICYGMELDTKYCDVIIERWEQFTGQKATKL
mgnify:FL=1|tara:strand:- start:233 stop:1444 length:1212 start_codon:yes stop_codon:yes gene_type:complete